MEFFPHRAVERAFAIGLGPGDDIEGILPEPRVDILN